MIFEKTESTQKKAQSTRRHRETIAELARIHAAKLTRGERALLALILERNITYTAIAAATGLSKSTVCRRYQRILKKLQTVDAQTPKSVHPDRTDRLIRRLYATKQLSQTQIAARLNLSRYRVRCALKRTRPVVSQQSKAEAPKSRFAGSRA